MTAKPENYEELTRLIAALLEGRLSEPEREQLEAMLESDAQARRLYMQMIDQEVELSSLVVAGRARDDQREKIVRLSESLREPGSAGVPPARPSENSPARRRRSQVYGRWRRRRFAAAAAVLLAGTALGLFLLRDQFAKKTVKAPGAMIPSPLAREWGEDFEQGVLRGWTGRLVSTNLPPGSKHGIAPVMKEYPVGGPVYLIQLPEEWNQGLFTLTTGSIVHVTYRIANRGHVNVFMHTIPADRSVNRYEMYQFAGAPFWGNFGQWQTVSIPFSKFMRKVVTQPAGTREFVGGPPQSGELVTTLIFSSLEPIDFLIDRVWVTATELSK